ncbi:MAG: DUF5320 domain-containing protein [Anaerolineae bacterium]
MPRGDGTGPAGMGPRTGRGLGPCSGYPTPGSTNTGVGQRSLLGSFGRWVSGLFPRLGLGRGQGLGRGMGRGRGRRY